MADNTESAIRVNLDNWYSVNSLFNIPIGEEFLLHNLSTKSMQVSLSDTQPMKGALNWLPLYTYKPYLPQAFDSEVWVYGDGFINTSDLTYDELDVVVANKGTGWEETGLTDDELRASDVNVSLDGETVGVRDDYELGELLNDQTGSNAVSTFTFSSQVTSFWVAVVGEEGVVKIDHYGGTPSPTRGIPVEAGGVLPIPEPATVVKIYIPSGLIVTMWGQLR
jgi:hypothetical protein